MLTKLNVPEALIEYNNRGMAELSSGKFKEAFRFLSGAEKLLRVAESPDIIHQEDQMKLLALTCNNLGCYYKRGFKPNVALRYMNNALDLEL